MYASSHPYGKAVGKEMKHNHIRMFNLVNLYFNLQLSPFLNQTFIFQLDIELGMVFQFLHTLLFFLVQTVTRNVLETKIPPGPKFKRVAYIQQIIHLLVVTNVPCLVL